MTYDGNRLASVRDNVVHSPYVGATDFYTESKTRSYRLTYNGAGSLISDVGRNIAYIKYDNNNPVLITFTDGSETEYVYSATGEKLRVIYITAKPNVVTRKVGEFIDGRLSGAYWINYETVDYLLGGALTLKNGRIDKYQFEEGYCQASAAGSVDYFDSYYYDRDHLGNIRQVIEPYGTNKSYVIQKMDYYPFGAEFCDNSTKSYVQNHKYNGKEFDNMHGLNTYDYGARQYNPVTGRWDRMDPLCEKYYSTSPYAYCMNNPVMRIDPDGKKVELAKNCSQAFAEQYNNAIEYLKQNGASEVFEKLDARPEVITISEHNGNANYALGAAIGWNPKSAMFVTAAGEPHLLSPAIRLLHEMGHQLQKLTGEYNTSDDGSSWQSPEEKRNILDVETPAAIACKEIPEGTISRDSHTGVGYETDSSTSTKFSNPNDDTVQMLINFWGLQQ